MKVHLKNPFFYLMLLGDAFLFTAALVLAHLFRFEFALAPIYTQQIQSMLLPVLLLKSFTFFWFGLYKGMWRYTSTRDFWRLLQASATSTLLIMTFILIMFRFEGYSRAAFIMDGGLTFLFTGGLRMAIRTFYAQGDRNGKSFVPVAQRERILVVGAGAAGEKILREIIENDHLPYAMIGFIDDDRKKQGRSIHGVPVLGSLNELARIVEEQVIKEVLIAVPSATGDQVRRIVAACKACQVSYKTLPGIGELIDGRVSMRTIREVRLEDIMGREEVRLDREGIARSLGGRRVLVTGAGGSIGSELVRQIGCYRPGLLVLLDFSELNLFEAEMECRGRFPGLDIRACLADIRDRDAVARIFRECRPDVVFHAAAYKHVPLQELHPREAVRSNILGTRNLAELARETAAERFILVSTDKAVRPTNVMGATKRVAEMLILGMNESPAVDLSKPTVPESRPSAESPVAAAASARTTRFLAVRFGNVLGSSGSVLPIFQRQIARFEPVTVTHPDVTRYFMSISEAAQLILQAGVLGDGGEIFILDMGKPVRIADMARDLIRFHGLEPDVDIPIRYIGLRPGEKLYEELITEGEGIRATAHEKIRVIRGNHNDLAELNRRIDALVAVAETYNADAIKTALTRIVPEYHPQFPLP